MDRDIHAAQNMLDIFHLVDDYMIKNNLVPMDYREVKLVEFKTAMMGTSFPSISQNVEARRCHVFSIA